MALSVELDATIADGKHKCSAIHYPAKLTSRRCGKVAVEHVLELAQAEPRQSKERNVNYILRRQEAGLVSGVPTLRRIRGGGREIDIYPNGLMFEKDHVVDVLKH
jgi:hypothetical protein